jgi:PadR family transcriptional regulator
LSWYYILNDVRQILPQDYYAPVVGEFEHFVLLALVRLGNGAYGAAIRREIIARTGRDASEGTVYMTLGRLEKKKMIVSYVGVPSPERGGRRRRHYLIDAEGQRALGRAYRAFTAMADGIEGELREL